MGLLWGFVAFLLLPAPAGKSAGNRVSNGSFAHDLARWKASETPVALIFSDSCTGALSAPATRTQAFAVTVSPLFSLPVTAWLGEQVLAGRTVG